jgi:hypothetical protein
MLQTILDLIPGKRVRGVAMAATGMGALLAGRKVVALGLFAKGAHTLEQCWREAHPDFHGTLADRWQRAVEFYEKTHADPTNRTLHIVGIPFIVGGAVGLLIFRPYRPLWFVSAAAFTGGWITNFIGHGVYEKKAPAFADDPLSFLAGPVWDLNQMRSKGMPKSTNGHTIDIDPAGQVV